jgi:FxsC-like protein
MDALPCFFFSYARKDHNTYLNKFFNELKERVAQKGVLDDEKGEVSFRDIDGIELGADWGETLSAYLARCLTMVAVYSPWYFARPYCGKEFRVFLDRQGNVTYDGDGCARGSEKIVPVLWERWADLARHEFPPAVTRFIQVTAGKHEKLYKELGLLRIRSKHGRRGPFADILDGIADALIDQAKKSPLQPLANRPSLPQTQNAFERIERPRNLADVGPNALLIVYLTAAGLQIPPSRASRYVAGHPRDWRPYDPPSAGELHLSVREGLSALQFKEFVEPVYDLTAPNAASSVIQDLRAATTRNVPSLVVLDPWVAASEQGRAILKTIMADEKWNGAIIVPVDVGDAETTALLPRVDESWRIPPEWQHRLLSVASRGTLVEFEHALLTAATELQKRIAASGSVSREASGDGASSLPLLGGPAGRKSHA